MNTPELYNESIHFATGSTPFGYYDNDSFFINDVDKVAKWCAFRLGYPQEAVELHNKQIWTCFEEAISTYGNLVYEWKIQENYLSLEGMPTASNLNNTKIIPNLANIIEISETYGAEIGVGGNLEWYTGYVDSVIGQQVYDLDEWAAASASLQPGDKISIKKVFFEAPPAIVRYFDPYVGTGMGLQTLNEAFGFANYSPAINFMMMPLSFDISKMQAIELNDQVRKSDYSFDIVNNKLRIFPIPTRNYRIFFKYIKKSERYSNNSQNNDGIVTDVSKVPYDLPVYSQINQVGLQWIRQYTLALCKENLAYIRGKYDNLPLTNNQSFTLNYSELIADARTEKETLTNQLREFLEGVTRQKQLERKSLEEEYLAKSISIQPHLPIFIF